MVTVEVRVAVKLHDVCLGVFLFDLRCEKNLHDLSCETALLCQVGIFHNLLGDCASALPDFALILYKGEACTKSCDPVHSGVALKSPVLLCDVGVLDVHADLADRDILVVSCVDQTNLAAILVVDFRVRKHAEIGALHLRQLVIGDGTAVIQFGADFCINEERHKRTDDHDACQDLKHAIKKPAKDSKDACRNS